MALSNAERQKRYRERKRAEQQKSAPRAARPVTKRVTPPVVTTGLDARGDRLWREMDGDKLEPAKKVLLEEACRLADRLDKLDAFLQGREDAWLKFHSRNEDGSIVQVVVDKALSEARQQAVALKQILSELRQGAAKAETEGSVLDQLAARRAQRLANTSG